MSAISMGIIEDRGSTYFNLKYLKLLGKISCQFLSPGGSMGSRYILQLQISEKLQSCL
jgi:hypothetical protein